VSLQLVKAEPVPVLREWLRGKRYEPLYIRRIKIDDGYHYILRETVRDHNAWTCRDLMDLGTDPCAYIEYPGGNSFYFSAEVDDVLRARGAEYSSEDLEKVFLPFLEPDIRRVVQNFSHTPGRSESSHAAPGDDLWKYEHELHPFDKRRLHYLRCGRIDIGELEGRSWKFLKVLLGKCRDEIESVIEGMEGQLRPHELGSYVYAAFNLQSHFAGHVLKNTPEGLDPEMVDTCLLEEICSLNGDPRYFAGMNGHDGVSLHPFLVKYVILHFDCGYERRPLWDEYMNEFERRRRFAPRGPLRARMELKEAFATLGITAEEYQEMGRKELVRRYRRRAKNSHPDQGGNHEDFLKLTEAYELLMSRK
jgi:hypothetical protein